MGAAEPYDYLSTISADYGTAVALKPSNIITEDATKRQIVNEADDNSVGEVITLSSDPIVHFRLEWANKTASDAGTLYGLWMDSAKANGIANTWKFTHPTDGHTYVVRFACDLIRQIAHANVHGILSVRLRVHGRIADA